MRAIAGCKRLAKLRKNGEGYVNAMGFWESWTCGDSQKSAGGNCNSLAGGNVVIGAQYRNS